MTYSKHIVLVDDDLDIADMVVAYFKQKDIGVHPYQNPLQAAQDIISGHVQADAVITDLNMPEMSGIEFMKKLKAEGQTLPVIFITASNDVEVALQATEAGAYDFVVKPLHFPQLLISVQRAFRIDQLKSENRVLKTAVEMTRGGNVDGMIGRSEELRTLVDIAKRVARCTSTVYISGESGSGKEILARCIHKWSPRKDKPFIAINCSAIPENLLESELFGHAKGGFTGAIEKKIGLFEEAEGGTLFLDEIGDMNLNLQAKLLRVLQERKIKRIGENLLRSINVRIITATHKDLRAEVKDNRFREDLFFRLNVIPLRVPPLRERKEDILPLADYFLKKFSALNEIEGMVFSKEAKEYLLGNPWQGNVRELENSIERAVVLATTKEIDRAAFSMPGENTPLVESFESTMNAPAVHEPNAFIFRHGDEPAPLAEIQKSYIQYVFERNNRAREFTAKALGIDRKTLYRKLQEIEAVN